MASRWRQHDRGETRRRQPNAIVQGWEAATRIFIGYFNKVIWNSALVPEGKVGYGCDGQDNLTCIANICMFSELKHKWRTVFNEGPKIYLVVASLSGQVLKVWGYTGAEELLARTWGGRCLFSWPTLGNTTSEGACVKRAPPFSGIAAQGPPKPATKLVQKTQCLIPTKQRLIICNDIYRSNRTPSQVCCGGYW